MYSLEVANAKVEQDTNETRVKTELRSQIGNCGIGHTLRDYNNTNVIPATKSSKNQNWVSIEGRVKDYEGIEKCFDEQGLHSLEAIPMWQDLVRHILECVSEKKVRQDEGEEVERKIVQKW